MSILQTYFELVSDMKIVPLGSGGVINRDIKLVMEASEKEGKDDLLAYCKHASCASNYYHVCGDINYNILAIPRQFMAPVSDSGLGGIH